MRHIAIVGSGPAGYYTAEAAVKQWGEDARVDIFDKLPVPFGLIRTGVAPDHQSIKAVARRYEKTAIGDTVRFVGNVEIGRDIAIEELTGLYDAVILATGAPRDRDLPIPGADSANVFGSAAFVGWYNGHPEYAALAPDLSGRHAVIIGMGNVALDVARILSKTEAEFEGSDIVAHALELLRDSNIETITILGRRGPHQIMMTPKELGELLRLERAVPRVENADLPPPESDDMLDPGQRKSVTLLREFAALSPSDRADKPLSINFDFFASPTLIEQEGGQLSGLVVERTELKDGRAVGSGETYRIPADLLISCIGYRTSPIVGVPFDERAGRFPNEEGRIAPALYCVGWAKRGPSGTIGTNRPDGYAVIEKVAEDIGEGAGKRGREGFDELAQKRALDVVTFRDWQRIEEAEIAAARSGAPREKFVDIESMIAARGA
ncbi:FAD-dependent oxidoreductase [Qipengyuania flava]|uniref:FAD-dependent oxidoreductase n=1 Tax=Qipengyuania flava TaxID=192812 RepID=UPI00273EEBF3|nr:FAD-dependent oxidoreductase [Qipengyuania flava]